MNDGRLELECKFGTLVCEVMRGDDEYKEFAIDLYADDGRIYQVAVIGTNEYDEIPSDSKVHIYCYDGNDEDNPDCKLMDPAGDGWFDVWKEEK